MSDSKACLYAFGDESVEYLMQEGRREGGLPVWAPFRPYQASGSYLFHDQFSSAPILHTSLNKSPTVKTPAP